MARLESTITISNSEYRPCFVDGKKALFHKWEEKETPILSIGTASKANYRVQAVIDIFKTRHIIPEDCELIKQKQTLAIVEYENGAVAEVEPTRIQFVSGKMNEYAF